MGGLYPAAVNGANEEAVKLFLNDKIDFLDIAELSRQMLRESFEKHILRPPKFSRPTERRENSSEK